MNVVNMYKFNVSNTGASKSHNLIYNEMKICLGNINLARFPTDWEEHILNLISRKYRKKYFPVIQLILKEIEDIYVKDMQNYIMETILLMPKKNMDNLSVTNCMNQKILNEKNGFNYGMFINRRKLLREKYFLWLEPIKIIVNIAQSKLPTVICNFDHYCSHGLISLIDFQNMINSDIKKSVIRVNQFYTKVSKAVAKTAVMRHVDKQKLSNIMQCITHVFVQQIINMMIRSIDHLLNVISNGYHCPQIKFQLILQNNQLLLSPSIEEIYSVYHNIIDNISTIAHDLIPLEEWLNLKTHSTYIKVKLPDWYVKESHTKLHTLLCNSFQSINEHVTCIRNEFDPICVPTYSRKIRTT